MYPLNPPLAGPALRPVSTLFMSVMQPIYHMWHSARGPALSWYDFLLVLAYIWQEDFAKVSKVPGAPAQCKSGPVKNMVSRRNHVLHHFLITIHFHLASFYATKYF